MKYSIYVELPGDESPREVANKVGAALRAAGEEPGVVQYGQLDTIIWVDEQMKIEGIEYQGSGYGAPRHLAILERANG